YIQIGKDEGAELIFGGHPNNQENYLSGGYYIKPTLFFGHNQMHIFQEEIFGPVIAITKFKDEIEALHLANDTVYGLGAGVWTRDIN
ncbi:aldehyde dehydrogenase family protein, partial [Klebsiella pneumoniae]